MGVKEIHCIMINKRCVIDYFKFVSRLFGLDHFQSPLPTTILFFKATKNKREYLM